MKDNTKTESYQQERAFIINRLSSELLHLDDVLNRVKKHGDEKEYLAVMRCYLATQKEFLKLIAAHEADENAPDALTEFASVYNERGIMTV